LPLYQSPASRHDAVITLLLAAITVFVGIIAGRTVIVLARGEFIP
jgi:hypothetical protein